VTKERGRQTARLQVIVYIKAKQNVLHTNLVATLVLRFSEMESSIAEKHVALLNNSSPKE
jgi:hypothetical protein